MDALLDDMDPLMEERFRRMMQSAAVVRRCRMDFGLRQHHTRRLLNRLHRQNRRYHEAEQLFLRHGHRLLFAGAQLRKGPKAPLPHFVSSPWTGPRVGEIAKLFLQVIGAGDAEDPLIDFFFRYHWLAEGMGYHEWNSLKSALTACLLREVEAAAQMLERDAAAARAAERIAGRIIKAQNIPRALRSAAQGIRIGGGCFCRHLYAYLACAGEEILSRAEAALERNCGVRLSLSAAGYSQELARLAARLRGRIDMLETVKGLDVFRCMERFYPPARILQTLADYPGMTRESRWHCLAVLHAYAVRSRKPADEVASAVVHLAGDGGAGGALLGAGGKALAKELGISWYADRKRHRYAYCCNDLLPALSILMSGTLFCYALIMGAGVVELAATFFLGYLIFFSLLFSLFSRLAAQNLAPVLLPQMQADRFLPEEGLLVVMRVTAASVFDIRRACDALAWHREQLKDRRVSGYLLLMDLASAERENMSADAAIRRAAREHIRQLNRQYGGGFTLLARRREYSAQEGRWRCFDGPMGAIVDLSRSLLGEDSGKVLMLEGELHLGAKYLLLLKPDVRLPSQGVRALYGAMRHPANKDAGYLVMQPRLQPYPMQEDSRIWGALGSGAQGLSRTDLEMRMTGRCRHFCGSGMLDLEGFYQRVQGLHMPEAHLDEGRVLPMLCRTACLSAVVGWGSCPLRYSLWLSCLHREVRALFLYLPHPFYSRYSLDQPWRERQGVIRSAALALMPVAVSQLLVVSTYSAGNPVLYAVIGTSPYWAPLLWEAACGLFWAKEGRRKRKEGRRLLRCVLPMIFCAFEASVILEAAVRTLWDAAIRRRELLRWITLEQAEKGTPFTLLGYARLMWVSIVCGAAMVPGAAYHGRALPALAMTALWALAPFAAIWLDGGNRTAKRL